MNTVFLDTVGLLANWDTTDQWHAAAAAAFQRIVASRRPVVTSTLVMVECGNAAARRPYRSAVARLREEMQASGRLITPTDVEWQAAWTAYGRPDPTLPGIVDFISFEIMRRLNITDVFGNDRHFLAAGFRTLF